MAEKYFGISDIGKVRGNNEDTFIAEPVLRSKFIAACVIDGVGGYEGGEVAASIARQAILDYFSIPSGTVSAMMREALLSANEKIWLEKEKSGKNDNMGCVATLALLEKQKNKFYYAHIGDTRLYLLRDNSLVKVTKDHSFVGFLEDTGRLNEDAAMAHPKRNEINKALGYDVQIPNPLDFIETGESPFLPGDMILLCSDGLTDMIDRNKILTILSSDKSLQEKGKALVEAANNAGGKDNITVVLVKNEAPPLKLKATKPGAKGKRSDAQVIKQDKEAKSGTAVAKKPGKNKRVIGFLSILGLFLVAALVWTFMNDGKKKILEPQPLPTTTREKDIGQLLQDTIDRMEKNSLLLTDSIFGHTIFLSDSIVVRRDSLYVIGRDNIVITSDTTSGSYRRVVFISPGVKYILLENLALQNIDIGISMANSSALHFKNVKFKNSTINAVNYFSFEDSLYSGSFSEMKPVKNDSLK